MEYFLIYYVITFFATFVSIITHCIKHEGNLTIGDLSVAFFFALMGFVFYPIHLMFWVGPRFKKLMKVKIYQKDEKND